jgi:hypothetical protein
MSPLNSLVARQFLWCLGPSKATLADATDDYFGEERFASELMILRMLFRRLQYPRKLIVSSAKS